MLCTAPTLRTAALTCRLQPSLVASANLQTTSTPVSRSESTHMSSRRAPLTKRNVVFPSRQANGIRHASTTTSSSSADPITASSPAPDHLDWNTFFKLRKTRRWYQLGSSVGTSFTSFAASTQVLINADMDPIISQLPLDPMISLGLMTFAAGGVGWLVGPIVGTGIFNVRNRKFKTQIAEKEKEFYRRVKRFRVDPSASSLANPVPDYYGEKISSVGDYRRWLKDQRAFNKKRQTYV